MKPNPGRSRKLQQKAIGLLNKNQPQEALKAARDSCQQNPNNADAWLVLAAAYAQLNDYKGIIDSCNNAVQHQPGNVAAHFNLGVAHQTIGNLGDAEKAYREALALQPDHTASRLNLATLQLARGKAEEALDASEALLRQTPGMPEACNLKGNALIRLNRPQDALEWCNECRKTQGDTPQLLLNLARCHNSLGEPAKAEELLQQITRANPRFAPAWADLGLLARQQEKYAQSAECYERAATLQPSRENRFNLAHSLYAAKRIEEARKLYHDLLLQTPDDPVIHNNLGRLYENAGRIEDAETHFRKSVELQPGHAIPHCNLGRILLGLGRLNAAEKEFLAATTSDPEYFEGHYGLGQALCEMGRNEQAVEAFEKALQLKPDLSEARYYVASIRNDDPEGTDKHDYVSRLFDKYADNFDEELTKALKYKTPEALFQLVESVLTEDDARLEVLDLGCGTGLCAPLFRPMSSRLVGVDLSGGMVKKAEERGLYDELAVEDIVEFMKRTPKQSFDLILAADVFVYIGDLKNTFEAAKETIRPSGYFAFSTESHEGEGFRVKGSGRHAHSRGYIETLASAVGFSLLAATNSDIRLEYRKPVNGTLYLFKAA